MDFHRFSFLEILSTKFNLEGHEIYLAGKCVRDAMIGRNKDSIEMITTASEDDIFMIAGQCANDTQYAGNDHDGIACTVQGVSVVINPMQDIRDYLSTKLFTIDAILVKILPMELKVIDPFGGVKDLESRTLNVTIDAKSLIISNPHMILRCATVYGDLGLKYINTNLLNAIKDNISLLSAVPKSMIRDELMHMMASSNPAESILFVDQIGAIEYLFPNMSHDRSFMVNSRHQLFWHLLDTLKKAALMTKDPEVRLAAMLHDTGKFNFNKDHYLASAENAKLMLKELQFSENSVNKVYSLIKRHMDLTPEMLNSDEKIRKFMYLVGDDWKNHIILRTVNDAADGGTKRNPAYLRELEKRIQDMQTTVSTKKDKPRFPLTIDEIIYHFKIKDRAQVGRMHSYLKSLYEDGQVLPNEKFKALYLIAKKFNIE